MISSQVPGLTDGGVRRMIKLEPRPQLSTSNEWFKHGTKRIYGAKSLKFRTVAGPTPEMLSPVYGIMPPTADSRTTSQS
jgi:hypothetical protein